MAREKSAEKKLLEHDIIMHMPSNPEYLRERFEHVPTHPAGQLNRYSLKDSDAPRTAVIIDVHGSISPWNLKVEKVKPQKTSLRKRG